MAADAILGSFMKVILSKVVSAANEQVNLVVGFRGELRKLHATLKMIMGVLDDAEQRGLMGRADLKAWLEGLRSIAEEADDVMDEIAYENLRGKVAAQKQMLKQVGSFFTPANPLAFRLQMANKIKNLDAALVDLNTRATGLGLQDRLANKSPEPGEIQQTDSLLGDPSGVIGRDSDVQKIVQLLIDPSNQQPLCAVSIVGIAGLGKTTLAKLVCNNDQIQGHFSKIMWICVSENFDVKRVLVQMLESLTKDGCEKITSQDVLVQKIKEELEEENFLLILDDVWNEDRAKWEDLRGRLLGMSKKIGSGVLVTTRTQNVASVMGTLPEHVHSLQQLKDDDCWSIIKHRVFGNSPIPKELENIGREIANKCKGVPLLSSVVGGTLCNNRKKDDWLSIKNNSEVWGSVEEANGAARVLQLSFDRLPKPTLKQCFSFCSIFPKDFVMEREVLIQLWMAEGFVQPFNERYSEMEDIGDKYFNDLLSYSLFQDAIRDSSGTIIACKMHDLIHNLALSISKSQTLILENGSWSSIPAGIRHLNLISVMGMATTEVEDVFKNLHTLFSQVNVFCNIPAKVRVLSFRGAKIDKLPAVLGKLKHLRYLDVSETAIKELPKFITKLYHLQTFKFMSCWELKRPLKGIGNLVNLRHIYFNCARHMPPGIGRVTCLRSLQLFFVGPQEGCQIEELECLSQLRGKLKISNLKNVRNRSEAMRAKLFEKPAINELELEFEFEYVGLQEERCKHDEDILEGLQPHSNVKSLAISKYRGEKCPSWILRRTGNFGETNCLRNLVLVKFSYCHLLESIPSLSLSSEAKVEISHCRNLKSISDSSFQKLIISVCRKLVSVEVGPLAMTSLKELYIERCYRLESVPMISALPSLHILHLKNCWKLSGIGDSDFSASTCLEELTIYGCSNLMFIHGIGGLSSLKKYFYFPL